MPFTPPQIDAIKTALGRYLKACPICRHNRWHLATEISFVPTMVADGTVELGRGLPCISAVCVTCGGVQFFNAYTVGLSDTLGLAKAEDAGQS